MDALRHREVRYNDAVETEPVVDLSTNERQSWPTLDGWGLLPVVAVIGGAWAFGAPLENGALTTALAALVLVLGGWLPFWRALTLTPWAESLALWRTWEREESLPRWPYLQPGTPGAALHRALQQARAWWRAVGQTALAAPLRAAALALVVSVLAAMIVGRDALLLTLFMVAWTEMAVLWRGGRGDVGSDVGRRRAGWATLAVGCFAQRDSDDATGAFCVNPRRAGGVLRASITVSGRRSPAGSVFPRLARTFHCDRRRSIAGFAGVDGTPLSSTSPRLSPHHRTVAPGNDRRDSLGVVIWAGSLVIIGLVVVAALLYWQLILAEGAYLGRRVVILLYDWSARVYDRIKGYNPGYEQWFLGLPLTQALADFPDPLILDVATGTARLARTLFQQGSFHGRLIGVDLSRKMLQQAAQATEAWSNHITLICQDAGNCPSPTRPSTPSPAWKP